MAKDVKARKSAALATPTDLGANATKDLTGGLNILLADVLRSTSRPRTSTGTCRARISATTTCCSTTRRPRSTP